jgi:glycerol-3-phosphate dehydrogenase (NAD+)
LLNGQKLQGPITAAEVNFMLKNKNMENDFPLFTTVHKICIGELKPSDLIEQMKLNTNIKTEQAGGE